MKRSKKYLERFHRDLTLHHIASCVESTMKATRTTPDVLAKRLGLESADELFDKLDDQETKVEFIADVFTAMGSQMHFGFSDIPTRWKSPQKKSAADAASSSDGSQAQQ